MKQENFQRALVKTKEGYLKGTIVPGLKVFRGVPYARAPVGRLRWQPPVPVSPWNGVRSAMHFGCEAMQAIDYDSMLDSYGIASGTAYSEDCLYLNIYTPAEKQGDRLPVFFWIHGGGFNSGGSSQALYPGEALARKGKMVVVTINYRLGIFGFFSHPELDVEQDGYSGNYGFLDQIQALKWVKNNISAFGGNPDAICIAGQSAGSISIGAQLFAPEAEGLFQRAILQSGPILGRNLPFDTKEGAQRKAVEFFQYRNIVSVKQARDIDAWELFDQAAQYEQMKGKYYFWPCIDGRVLAKQPIILLEEGRYQKVDLLCGATSEEFGSQTSVSLTEFQKFIKETFGSDAQRIQKSYSFTNELEAIQAWIHLRNDAMIKEVLDMADALTTEKENRAYCYYFSRPMQGITAIYGAPHSAELPFLFQREDYGGPMPWHKCSWTDADRDFSETMIQMWSAFVYGKQPSPQWRPFSQEFIMELGIEIAPLGDKLRARLAAQEIVPQYISVNKRN